MSALGVWLLLGGVLAYGLGVIAVMEYRRRKSERIYK